MLSCCGGRRRGAVVVRARALSLVAALAAGAQGLAARGAAAQGAGGPGGGRVGPYERALRLVEGGAGAEGRALADSLVRAAAPGSPALGEALWWRAAFALDAAAAERDLRRLVAEVPGSPRAGGAVVRLAQLALLRDRPDDAAALLEPLTRGRADDPMRAVAGYWLARARVERGDPGGACAAMTAAAATPGLDADLAGQLGALRRRVGVCDAPAPARVPTPVVASRADTAPAPAPAAAPAPAPAAPAPAAAPPPPAPAPNVPPPAAPAVAAAPAAPAPAAAAAPASAGFAVQVAAYDVAAQADALVARLRGGGLDAYREGQGAAGDAPPFRVKVGRHATRAEAAAALGALRRRGLAGFVTTARP